MKKWLLVVSCWMLVFSAKAQMLLSGPFEVEFTDPMFNSLFIKEYHIKRVQAALSEKADGDPIVDRGLVKVYDFDSTGNPVRFYKTAIKTVTEKEMGSGKHSYTVREYTYDTSFTFFHYDAQHRLSIKRQGDGIVFFTNYYEYHPTGAIQKETVCKEINISPVKCEFKLGVQNVLSIETFDYVKTGERQIKKRCLNDEGRLYRSANILYDEKAHKLEEKYEYVVSSWIRQSATYQYNTLGQLTEKKEMYDSGTEVNDLDVYQYDKYNNLTEQMKHHNGNKSFEISYLYEETGKLLKSRVARNFAKKTIEITRYSYEIF